MWKQRTVKDVVLKVKCVISASLLTLNRIAKIKTALNMELPLAEIQILTRDGNQEIFGKRFVKAVRIEQKRGNLFMNSFL